MRPNRLEQVKKQQLEADPECYAVATTESVEPAASVATNVFEQLQAAMVTDVARIKTVKKVEEKQAIKASLLPGYLSFVNDFVEHAHDYPNSVAVRVMIWLFDIGKIEEAITLGLYLVKTNIQSMPEKFNRDIETFICDEVYEWASTQLKAKQTADPYLTDLVNVMSGDEWDLHPLVASKTFAMLAKHRELAGQYAECVELCLKAEHANPDGAGVKTMKSRAMKLIPANTGEEQKEN